MPALGVDAKQTVYVEVDAKGAVKLEGRGTEAAQLKERLTALATMNPKINVVVRADKAVAWQTVVNVIETVTASGVTNLFYAISGRDVEPEK
jgi:biopolymer transport protein ExbD